MARNDSARAWTARLLTSITRTSAFAWPVVAFLLSLGSNSARPESPEAELDLGSVRLSLARVPATLTCRMGESFPDAHTDARELPAHDVRITKIRWAGRYEVTNTEFAAFLNAAEGASGRTRVESQDYGVQRWYDDSLGSAEIHNVPPRWTVDSAGEHVPHVRKEAAAWRPEGGSERRPVTGVSWFGANAFCAWVSQRTGRRVRLPTEAEWECLCRAGTTTRFWYGNEPSQDRMNASGVGGADRFDPFSQSGRRAPVGSFPPNPWGLYDTHGNVWEWTRDVWYRRYTPAAVEDPIETGPGPHRIYRGGAYERYGWACRSAARRSGAPSRMTEDLGFRVVVE